MARLDLLPSNALSLLDTVVDVGANEGDWSRAVLELAQPRRLIAVEPSPETVLRLRAAIGSISGVRIVAAAVGASAGEATLHVTSHSHNASLVSPRSEEMDAVYGGGYAVRSTPVVTVLTLDQIAAELDEVSLLKIDVQGSEDAALAGGEETLRKTRWLLIEANFRSHYRGDTLFPALHDSLAERGFVLTGLSPPHIRDGVALWCDALYERG